MAKVAWALLLADDPRHAMDAAVELPGVHLGANRVGCGEIQADDSTGVLSACYADGVATWRDRVVRRHESDPDQAPAVWRSIDTRAFASVPLVRNGRFVASLYVNFRATHRWTKAELDLIEEVASHTSAVVERARAQAELRVLNANREAASTRRSRRGTAPVAEDGRQVADAGRALRPKLKVLFLTGYAENAAVGNGLMEVGMQVMPKPFDIEGLTNKVREMLETGD